MHKKWMTVVEGLDEEGDVDVDRQGNDRPYFPSYQPMAVISSTVIYL
jgi:hypothetical protein